MSEIYEHDGIAYKLNLIPTSPEQRGKFKSIREAIPIIPESDWREIDGWSQFGDEYVLDQKSHGSCVGYSAAGSMMQARALAGQKTYQKLSGAYVYSYINGGGDNGASIGDALEAMMEHGVCLDSEANWDAIYPSRIPATARTTAQRFLLEEGYRVDSFEEAMSAVQCGFVVAHAVMVGGSFDGLDSESVIGFDHGPGNHAIRSWGAKKSAKWGWIFDGWNSWNTTWGNRGRFRSARKHWEGVQQDAYAIRVARFDPQDSNQPPVAK